jgi:hypothetical protein
MVQHFYVSNDRYLEGRPLDPLTGAQGISKAILEFLNDDLTSLGVDHRQHTIECHADDLSLSESVFWVGLPEGPPEDLLYPMLDRFGVSRPEVHSYRCDHTNLNPYILSDRLAVAATKAIGKRFRDRMKSS